MSRNKAYALGLALLFAALVGVEYNRPKPIDWSQTFSNKDKIPFGTYGLYELLPGIFPRQPVLPVRQPAANQLAGSAAGPAGNFIFINQSFQIDSLDLVALLQHAAQGSQVFISAEHFQDILRDTLHFETAFAAAQPQQKQTALSLTHPDLAREKPFVFETRHLQAYLELAPGQRFEVLGCQAGGKPNFVKLAFGAGAVYLHTAPLAFSNYYVVASPQSRYAALVLSHLPVAPVLWDEYQKQGRVEQDSRFRVLLAHEALRWAYYIGLSGLVLFVFFEGKRTQRIIPVLEKPRNTTLEFVQVLGSLYFNFQNHKIIADKQLHYFLEYLRQHFYVASPELDEPFQELVAAKTGLAPTQLAPLFQLIAQVRAASTISEQQLVALNRHLEDFYRLAGR
jgi:hypothetical protein